MYPRSQAGLCVAAAVALWAGAPLHAQQAQEPNWGTGGWELNAHIGLSNDEPEFSPDGSADQLRRDALVGARLSYVFPFNLFLSLEAQNTEFPVRLPDRRGMDLNSFWYGGAVGWNVQLDPSLQVFPVLGAGAVLWRSSYRDDTQFSFNYGLGGRYYVWHDLAVRADARVHFVGDAADQIRIAYAGPDLPQANASFVELTVGVTYFLGGPKDKDSDGVYAKWDRCPDTPRGAHVSGVGCPLDSDRDGRYDGLDVCPATPLGAFVDSSGCPADDDLDLVLNGIDRCAGTPERAVVDAFGCPLDSDWDGAFDGIDRCGDTPSGVEVDAFGCSWIQRDINQGLLVLQSLYFDFDRDELRPESQPLLDQVGRALLQRPGVRFEIQGHTDAVGSEVYNQGLSERRARGVLSYLVSRFPELDSAVWVARGYGKSQPIANNQTPEGRQENRRVEIRAILTAPQLSADAATPATDSGNGSQPERPQLRKEFE